MLRAWFSGRTRPCQGRDGSSILPTRTRNVLLFTYAPVAQWIERLASNQKVASSTLAGRTRCYVY
jgi:hypothetical protein